MKRILALASAGGHWSELMLMRHAFDIEGATEVCYITTLDSLPEQYGIETFKIVRDGNKKNWINLFSSIWSLLFIALKYRPNIVISTGAAIGVIGIYFGKALGAKTIWVDSIANPQKLSLSCRLCKPACDEVYTQWERLADGDVKYFGALF